MVYLGGVLMIYNDRLKILKPIKEETRLGEEVVGYEEEVYPCMRGHLTHNEQMGMFGSYQLDSFKLHVQGHLEGVKEVVYRDKTRQVKRLVRHKNATVIYV